MPALRYQLLQLQPVAQNCHSFLSLYNEILQCCELKNLCICFEKLKNMTIFAADLVRRGRESCLHEGGTPREIHNKAIK